MKDARIWLSEVELRVENRTDIRRSFRVVGEGTVDNEEFSASTGQFEVESWGARDCPFTIRVEPYTIGSLDFRLECFIYGEWRNVYKTSVYINQLTAPPEPERPDPKIGSADVVFSTLLVRNEISQVIAVDLNGVCVLDESKYYPESASMPNLPPKVPVNIRKGDGDTHYSWRIDDTIFLTGEAIDRLRVEVRGKEVLVEPPPPSYPPPTLEVLPLIIIGCVGCVLILMGSDRKRRA